MRIVLVKLQQSFWPSEVVEIMLTAALSPGPARSTRVPPGFWCREAVAGCRVPELLFVSGSA